MMANYRMEVLPKKADDGKVYWSAKFPTVPGCIVGGGNTPEEAIAEAQENLKVYLEYLEEEGFPIPESEEAKTEYNGKIALRVAKSTHRKLAERAKEEGISTNMLISNAIEFYLGDRNYDDQLNRKVDQLQYIAVQQFVVQQQTAQTTQDLWNQWQENQRAYVGGENNYV